MQRCHNAAANPAGALDLAIAATANVQGVPLLT
jgi:hypothetical protein